MDSAFSDLESTRLNFESRNTLFGDPEFVRCTLDRSRLRPRTCGPRSLTALHRFARRWDWSLTLWCRSENLGSGRQRTGQPLAARRLVSGRFVTLIGRPDCSASVARATAEEARAEVAEQAAARPQVAVPAAVGWVAHEAASNRLVNPNAPPKLSCQLLISQRPFSRSD